jgi:hypothetical protein
MGPGYVTGKARIGDRKDARSGASPDLWKGLCAPMISCSDLLILSEKKDLDSFTQGSG